MNPNELYEPLFPNSYPISDANTSFSGHDQLPEISFGHSGNDVSRASLERIICERNRELDIVRQQRDSAMKDFHDSNKMIKALLDEKSVLLKELKEKDNIIASSWQPTIFRHRYEQFRDSTILFAQLTISKSCIWEHY